MARASRGGWTGVASVIGCAVFGVAWLVCQHDLPLWSGLRALVALYLLCLIPGYLIQRYVFGIRSATPFEAMLSSLLLGVLMVPVLWKAMGALGISVAFTPLILILGVAVPLRLGWHLDRRARLRRLVTPADGPVLWLSLLVMMIWSFAIPLVTVNDGRAFTNPHPDLLFHAGMVAELARENPIHVFPFISSVRNFGYHHLPDVWCDLFRRATGLESREAFFHLALPLRYFFLALGGYLVLVRRFGRTAALVGTACMFALVLPIRHFVPGGNLVFLYHDYAAAFGLIGLFLVFFYVSTITDTCPRGALLLASTLSVLILWYKANFALVVAPAVSLFVCATLVRGRDFRWLALCLGVQLLLTAARYAQLARAETHYKMLFEPLAYLRWEWAGLVLPAAAKAALHGAVERLPALIEGPVLLLTWIIYRFHIGLVVMSYLVLVCGFARSPGRAGGVDRLTLLVLACGTLGFAFLPVQENMVWEVAQPLRMPLQLLLLALMGPAICDFLRRRIRRGRASIAFAATVTAGVLIANGFALHRKALEETRRPIEFGSADRYACYRFIDLWTPPDSVILHPPRFPGGYEAGALTGRRMVLEGPAAYRSMFDLDRVTEDVGNVYDGRSDGETRTILERYDVDYVVFDSSESSDLMNDPSLRIVFRSGDMVVGHASRSDRLVLHDPPS